MMGVWQMYRNQGMRGSLMSDLLALDLSIPPASFETMEWESHAFAGFGSIMRSRFGTRKETFVSFKAGGAKGHYHNDELSFHFYGSGTPLSLDYNCSYHPRGDHAGLHNSMTFGKSAPITHAGDTNAVEGLEQLFGVGTVLAFNSTPAADVISAEVRNDALELSPIYPEDAKFQYAYSSRKVSPITHRRTMLLVKHPTGERLNDYLVVCDETQSGEPQQLNIHLLARDVKRDGALIRATGQYDADAIVFLADSNVPRFDIGRWYYHDEWMNGPGTYLNKDDKNSVVENKAWLQKIHDTDGAALIPPKNWTKDWTVGEYQKWLKIGLNPGQKMLWVLYPYRRGEPEPVFTAGADGRTVTVTLGNERDEISVASSWPADSKAPGQAWVTQNGKTTVLIESGKLVPLKP